MTDVLSLEALRSRFAQILEGLAHPPLGSGVALAEECGEVARVLLDHHAYGKPLVRADLGSELMDVVVCVCEIASLHGIDLDEAARAKVLDLAARAPGWRATLGKALEDAGGGAHPRGLELS